MTSLAIPQTGEPRRTNIRAVRSATSLRTPHTSQEQQQHGHQQQHTTLSRSPPDLSFSQSSLLSHNEADFMSNTRLHPAGAGNPRHQNSSGQLRDASNTGSSSTGKGDSWRSGYSQSGTGNSQVLAKRNANKQRVRLDSVFGTQLPGFPYINSAAAADPLILASSPNLASGSGHYSTQDLRGRASRTWSDRSASAAGSYSIGSRFTGSRARSASGGMLSETSATTTSSARTPGGVAAFETDPANTSSNCSGGSNSSDDVDLDLSFDMEVLRERQRELQRQALRQRSNSQSVKGKQPVHGGGQPPFDISGHTVPEDDEEEAEGDMLPGRGLYGTEDYRRYRLQGKQRMSRSAVELRSLHASTECHYDPPQPSFARDQLPSRRYSGQSDPGLIRKGQPTSWARQPRLAELSDRSAEVDLRDEPDSFGIDDELSAPNPSHANPLGWSSATTPPLSPAELVTFAEQQPGYSDGRRRGSFGATLASGSDLLRKRRPSFPLLNLLDRAKPKGHGGVDDGTRAESAVDMRPEEPGHASPAFGSPTPTREMYTSRHNSYTDNLAPLPPPPIIPAAVDAYPLSPIGSSLASPSGFSSPGTMTADLTPGTSAWNSPKMQDMDEAPTPRSGDFDEHDVGLAGDDLRFSQYSMTSAGVRTSALGVRKSLQALPSKAQKDEGSPEQNPDEKEPYKRSHVRQSSSIFRLPFSSLLFNPFRPASPAQTVKVPPIIEDDGNSGEATPTASKAPTIRPVENADATDATARPTSPASSDSHAPSSAQHGSGEGGSDESHGLSSDPPSPPRAGAKPSRLSAVIDGSMLRPGPTTGRGQMGGYGLGLSLDQEGGHPEGAPEALAQRQSSLPVLAFSSASSDENHGSSTSASSHSSQQAGGRVHQVVRVSPDNGSKGTFFAHTDCVSSVVADPHDEPIPSAATSPHPDS